MIGPYKRSKFEAEEVARELARERGLPAVIVNPSTPVGPGDIKPTPTGRLIVEAARGQMPAFVDTGLNIVHVDDVAAGHLAAAEKGRIGERYILGGENMTLAEILAEVARAVGRRPPRLRVPHAVLFPVAFGAELAARVTGREPFVTLRRRSHVAKEDVFQFGKGIARARLRAAAGARGHRRRCRLVQGQRISEMTAVRRPSCRRNRADSVETPSGKWRGGENFPVGSFLIRRDLRAHVHAFYRFARNADDIADNPGLTADEKIRAPRPHGGDPRRSLGRGFARRGGDAREPGRDRRDRTALPRRAARLSPRRGQAALSRLGRSDGVLPLFGLAGRAPAPRPARREPDTWPASDALCSALQVLNHLQDCADDYRLLDRVYLPLEDLAAEGTGVEALAAGVSNPALRRVLDRLLDRTAALDRASPRLAAACRRAAGCAGNAASSSRLLGGCCAGCAAAIRWPSRVKLRKSDFLAAFVIGVSGGCRR